MNELVKEGEDPDAWPGILSFWCETERWSAQCLYKQRPILYKTYIISSYRTEVNFFVVCQGLLVCMRAHFL